MAVFTVCMTVTGSIFLVMLRAFFIRHPVRTAKELVRALRRGGRRPYMALLLALAGTLGVGNLTGVALGLMIGGAGSVFWMWVASLFACVLKYAEGVLAVDMHTADGGGMMWTVRRTLRHGRVPAFVYALVCLCVAFFMGAALQSRAVAEAATAAYGLPPLGVSVALSAVLCCVMAGSVARVEKTAAWTVPLAAIGYIALCLGALIPSYEHIPAALWRIVRGAFSAEGTVGGVLGCLTSRAVRQGFAGCLLSNEAGAGTSTLAHARNTSAGAVGEGLLSMTEVVLDTLLCTLTGVCLVTVGGDAPRVGELSPMGWIARTFSEALGPWSGNLLFICTLFFAFSTIICWYYYGKCCAVYCFGKRSVYLYAAAFVSFVALGGRIASHVAVYVTDVGLCVLSVITLTTLLRASDRLTVLHRAVFRPHAQSTEAYRGEP